MNSKIITLEKAFELLQNAEAIILDADALIYPALDEVNGDDDNEFMYCSWDSEGVEYNVKFAEGANAEVTLYEDYMVLIDTEGQACSVKLLTTMSLFDQ